MLIIFSLALCVGVVLFFRFLNKPHKPPILGVYQQKNKYFCFKLIFMSAVLSFRKVST